MEEGAGIEPAPDWAGLRLSRATHYRSVNLPNLEEDRRIERPPLREPWGSNPVADHSAVSSIFVSGG